MLLFDGLKSSLQTIYNHKFRSFLTLLGIIIGVLSVVTMFSSVSAIKNIINDAMDGAGFQNVIVVRAGNDRSWSWGIGGFRRPTVQRRSQPLTYKDYIALRSEVDVKHIYGLIERWERTPENKWILLRATNVDFFHSKSLELGEGRFWNAFEMNRAEKVAIVGPTFSKDHFRGENPLEQYYTVGRNRYKIIGILKPDEQGFVNMQMGQSWWDKRSIYIPLHTGSTYLTQNKTLDTIVLQAHDLERFNYMKNHAFQTLLAHHNMARDFKFDDFNDEILKVTAEIEQFMKTWSIALIIIASISLLVGGIGLFSTLLISINERMMEIGIRKSVGATDLNIFSYFIIEALTLALIAGGIGIGIGLSLTQILATVLKATVPISMMSIYIGLLFSVGIGFLSGLYPAIMASKTNPIQAIYYYE
jgi:putative ABC transport system permease protein